MQHLSTKLAALASEYERAVAKYELRIAQLEEERNRALALLAQQQQKRTGSPIMIGMERDGEMKESKMATASRPRTVPLELERGAEEEKGQRLEGLLLYNESFDAVSFFSDGRSVMCLV